MSKEEEISFESSPHFSPTSEKLLKIYQKETQRRNEGSFLSHNPPKN